MGSINKIELNKKYTKATLYTKKEEECKQRSSEEDKKD
jgi:hypothetical protein